MKGKGRRPLRSARPSPGSHDTRYSDQPVRFAVKRINACEETPGVVSGGDTPPNPLNVKDSR